MKSFMKFNKLAIITLVSSSLFVACSDEISYSTGDSHYTASTANIGGAGQAVDLGLTSGTKWANMNVGATSENDNGILFVWGDVTGTQVLASNTTSYANVTKTTAPEALFNMYKGEEEKIGYLYDTLNVYKETNKPVLMHVDSAEISTIVKAIFDNVKGGRTGKLVATVTTGTEILCVCDSSLNDASVFYRYNNPKLTEIVDEDGYDIVVNLIDSTEVKYYENTKVNDFSEIKDVYDANKVVSKVYMGGSISGAPVYDIVKDAEHDAAIANWGNNWRMPTAEEVQELIDECKWEFDGSRNGYIVSSKVLGNNNSIFLPAAGYRYGEKWYGKGNAGYYASGQILGIYHFPSMEEQAAGSKGEITSLGDMPDVLIFQHGQFDKSVNIYNNLSTSYGFSIRPVAK